MADSASGFKIDQPVKADAIGIGQAQLRSWHETYINEELGITDTWIDENLGFLAETSGVSFREKQIADANKAGSNTLYLVVKDESGQVGGFLHVTRSHPNVIFEAIYLITAAQGTGIAHELMRRALVFAAAAPMEVTVASYNQRAIRFYEKYGFRRIPDSDSLYREKIPLVTMLRSAEEAKT